MAASERWGGGGHHLDITVAATYNQDRLLEDVSDHSCMAGVAASWCAGSNRRSAEKWCPAEEAVLVVLRSFLLLAPPVNLSAGCRHCNEDRRL